MGLDIPDVRLVVHWQHPASPEDYLQEFGRAGRDGKSAVAILFVRQKDSGLHEFMIGKTLENSRLPIEQKESALKQKLEALHDMRKLVENKRSCFRIAIKDYFEDPTLAPRLTLGVRILEFVFGTKAPSHRISNCCDVCDRGRAVGAVQWARRVLSGV